MRPSTDDYFLNMAYVVATRATCMRRQVGCVLVDSRNQVLATGYNGVPRGMPHCNQHDPFHETGFPHACDGAYAPSGTGLESCHAVHAEANALLQCHDVNAIQTAYCTTMPCAHCIKLLLNTSCQRLVYAEPYPHAEAAALWQASRRQLVARGKVI